MQPILVTGASGLLGSHVIKHLLLEKKYQAIALVRSKQKAKIWNKLDIQTIVGDLENCNFTLSEGIYGIIHTAAIAGDWIDKKKAYSVNVSATKFLLDQATKIGCQTFIHVSTIGVYGHSEYMNATEGRPYKNSSYYEMTKMEAEKIVLEYKKNYPKMIISILRLSSLYGEGDRHILPRFIRYLENGKFIFIGKGNSLYPILHASDGARAIIMILKLGLDKNYIYHLCDNSKITLREFITILQKNLGLDNKIRSIPYFIAYFIAIFLELTGKLRKKEPLLFRKRIKYLGITRHISINKIIKELNFEPEINPNEGIPSTIRWIEEENNKRFSIESSEYLDIIPYHLYHFLSSAKRLD